MDFQKQVDLSIKNNSEELRNQPTTHGWVPFDQMYRRKKHRITSLGGDSVALGTDEFRSGSCFRFISGDLLIKISCWRGESPSCVPSQTPQGTNQTEMRVKTSTEGRKESQMIQLVSCAEHGFGLWFGKLNSCGFGRFGVLYAFQIDRNLNNGV